MGMVRKSRRRSDTVNTVPQATKSNPKLSPAEILSSLCLGTRRSRKAKMKTTALIFVYIIVVLVGVVYTEPISVKDGDLFAYESASCRVGTNCEGLTYNYI